MSEVSKSIFCLYDNMNSSNLVCPLLLLAMNGIKIKKKQKFLHFEESRKLRNRI